MAKKLEEARAVLLAKYPFFAPVLLRISFIPRHTVDTLSIDRYMRMYYNEGYLVHAKVELLATSLLQIVEQILRSHGARRLDRDPYIWSLACLIESADSALGLGHPLGAESLKPAWFEFPTELSAEEYYAALSRLPPPSDPTDAAGLGPADGCGSGADGIRRTHELGPEEEQAGVVTTAGARAIRDAVAVEYRGHHTRRGTKPGYALRWVQQTLEPTVAWEPLLAGAVRRAVGWAAGRGEYTYLRPSRRAGSVPGVVLPGHRRPVPDVAVIVDTSASVDDALLARALGEVDAVLLALGVPGTGLTFYSVDAAVHTVQQLRTARDATLAGAGGTDLRHGFAAVDRQRPRPDVVITFTDADTPWPAAPPPGTAVIAAVLGRRHQKLPATPDWAVRVECLVDSPRW